MLAPYVIARSMFDEFFDSAFNSHSSMMRTDIKEMEQDYELSIDLPGIKKENLTAELKDGYLCINATANAENTDDRSEKYLRRERLVGSFRRAFYVGDKVKQTDIQAKFEDGVLHLHIPKEQQVQQVESPNVIAIES